MSNLATEYKSDIKIILLGDSAVGKSKLMERYLMDDYVPQQLSTYALTLYKHRCPHPTQPGTMLAVEFWDTAGQERFQSMHPSYYMGAHCCIMVFDVSRKITYKNLETWYDELIAQRGIKLPIIVVANKIDTDPDRAKKAFGFVDRRREARGNLPGDMPLYFCSASDGSNVVSVFKNAIESALAFKALARVGQTENFVDDVLEFIAQEKQGGGIFDSERPKKESKVDDGKDMPKSLEALERRLKGLDQGVA